MDKVAKALKNFCAEETGQDLVEYALLAALIAVACVATVSGLGTKIKGLFDSVTSGVPATAGSSGS